MPFAEHLKPHEVDLAVMKYIMLKVESCKDRNIEWKLTFTAVKNLMRSKHCFYTGVELTIPTKGRTLPTDLTIDRIDSKKPYERGNVVAVCHAANCLKGVVENPNNQLTMEHAAKIFSKASKLLGKQK